MNSVWHERVPDRGWGPSDRGLRVHGSQCGAKANEKSGISKDNADKLVKGITRKSGKQNSVEGKIRIVVAGLPGGENVAALCRSEGDHESLF